MVIKQQPRHSQHKLPIAGYFLLGITIFSFTQKNNKDIFFIAQNTQDTIPASYEKWNKATRLTAKHGYLIGTLINGDTVIINRNEYLQFAMKNGKIENSPHQMIFTKVEIEPEYPGGARAWYKYSTENLHYPEEAKMNKIEGTVSVRFLVAKDGTISQVESVSGPLSGGLREEAARLVKNSSNWNPAIQNLRVVSAYTTTTVMFSLQQR